MLTLACLQEFMARILSIESGEIDRVETLRTTEFISKHGDMGRNPVDSDSMVQKFPEAE